MSSITQAEDTLLPYFEKQVSFELDGRKIVGTLTAPEKQSTQPVVLILHGMGGNRNGAIIQGTSKILFGQTAKMFAENGIASLRISTGGRDGSEGLFEDMTLERRIQEVLAAIKWISKQDRFDVSKT